MKDEESSDSDEELSDSNDPQKEDEVSKMDEMDEVADSNRVKRVNKNDIPPPPSPTTPPKAQSVLDRLGVDLSAYDLDAMFSENAISGETHCANRVRFVVNVYLKWIRFTKSLNEEDDGIDINDLMENELPGKYSFIDLQVDFGRILRNNDLLKVDGDTVIDSECKESDEFIVRRHERPKDWYSRNGDKMDSLFFMDRGSSTVNEDEARRSVVVQHCLDSMHHYLGHRATIDMEKVIESIGSVDAQPTGKGDDDDIDLEDLLGDQLVMALDREINEQKASGRYRGRNRGIGTEKSNKFMSTNTYLSTTKTMSHPDPTEMENEHEQESKEDINTEPKPQPKPKQEQEAEEEIECEACFVEQLYNELHLHGVDIETVGKLRQFVLDQHFDTDSVITDCDEDTSTLRTILHSLSTWNHIDIDRIIDEFIFNYRSKTEEYSTGFRFYYWPFYKGNDAEYVPLFGNVIDHNPGYVLSDSYIECKYGSFKEEILSNQKSGFSMRDWMETTTKAKMKLKVYRKNKRNRPLRRVNNSFKKVYGIKTDDEATISHLMAILFYTNYSKACYEFSASFRKIFWNETDESLKRRHSGFAHQGRLLRELVECFGLSTARCSVGVFYHGINRDLIFRSTNFKLHGPLSTTSGLFTLSLFVHVDSLSIIFFVQSLKLLMGHSPNPMASSSTLITTKWVSCCLKRCYGLITTKRVSTSLLADCSF